MLAGGGGGCFENVCTAFWEKKKQVKLMKRGNIEKKLCDSFNKRRTGLLQACEVHIQAHRNRNERTR